jgi:hypothetical protein
MGVGVPDSTGKAAEAHVTQMLGGFKMKHACYMSSSWQSVPLTTVILTGNSKLMQFAVHSVSVWKR